MLRIRNKLAEPVNDIDQLPHGPGYAFPNYVIYPTSPFAYRGNKDQLLT